MPTPLQHCLLLACLLTATPGIGAHLDVFNNQQLRQTLNQLQAGDVVHIHAGQYSGFSMPRSGQPDAWIQLIAQPGAIIDGQLRGRGIRIEGQSFVHLEGFTIRNVQGAGIDVSGQYGDTRSGHIRIINNHTWNTGNSGIAVWGLPWGSDPARCDYHCLENVEIRGNTVEFSNNAAIENGGFNEAITVASGVDGVHVRDNIIRYNSMQLPASLNVAAPVYRTGAGGEGIDLKEGVRNAWVFGNRLAYLDKNAIYIDGGGSNCFYPHTYRQQSGRNTEIHIFGNLIHDTGDSGITITSEGSGEVSGVYLYNNIISRTASDGILLYDWELDSKHCLDGRSARARLPVFRNIRVFNNTLHQNARGGIALDHGWSQQIDIRNNLIVGPEPLRLRLARSINGDLAAVNYSGHVDFRDADALDFRLLDSPLNRAHIIDATTTGHPPEGRFVFNRDYHGQLRLQGKGTDFGALEFY